MLVRILIVAAVLVFLLLWARSALDVYRRGDLNRGEKAAWMILMLLIPFIGLLIYLMIRPSEAQIARNAAPVGRIGSKGSGARAAPRSGVRDRVQGPLAEPLEVGRSARLEVDPASGDQVLDPFG